MTGSPAVQHDAYAAEYDQQVKAYDCYITDLLFGLGYEYIRPGMSLLDAGIGSGLSSQLFAKAGVEIYGMDFSPAMLEICQAKGFTADLKLHDIQALPWPYSTERFDAVVCCGVIHFIPELDGIFLESRRVLKRDGVFAFTTRIAPTPEAGHLEWVQEELGGFEIFSHTPMYLQSQIRKHGFAFLKNQKCFIGQDVFALWVVQNS